MIHMTEVEILQRIKELYRNILGEKLVGIYVHGSIAFQCFNWNKSDIDFLAVVNQVPALEEKEALISVLLELDTQCPPKGLEMSVVLEKVCGDFVYPTPFELHFSNSHKESCKADLKGYCLTMNGTDKDLAAHFTVVRQAGVKLYGKEISLVFGDVPKNNYIDSIKNDIKNAVAEIEDDPVYIILNLCRVFAYIREDLVLSKEQGGKWGLENLPQEYLPVIAGALNSYCRDDQLMIEKELGIRFAEHMLKKIFNA